MKISKISSAFFAVLLLILATSCVETVVAGSAVGGAVVVREKSIPATKSDIILATKLGSSFIKNGLKTPGNSVDITVNEGRVLLTGIVRDEEKAKLAVKLSWEVGGAKEVIDEIQIKENGRIESKDFSTAVLDYAITAQIETKLLFSRHVSFLNYQVTTVGKTVYLLGVARDNEELEKVEAIAAKIRGVEKVVNHAILANDSRRRG